MSTLKFLLKTDEIEFEVSKRPVPKVDQKGVQTIDRVTGLPVFSVELTAWTNEEEGSAVITASVPAPALPDLRWREAVEVVDLEMIPWSNKGRDGEVRSGVAFRAKSIQPRTRPMPAAA